METPPSGSEGGGRKIDSRGVIVSASGARVKAGADAPPLSRLTALTRAPDPDLVPPCNRWPALNSCRVRRAPRVL